MNLSQVQDIAVLGPAGDVDLHEGRHLLEQIKGLLQFERGKIVLDFREVQHIHYQVLLGLMVLSADSTVLLSDAGGGIKLANLNVEAKKILQVTGGDRFFETYDSLADAIMSFERPLFSATDLQ